VGEASHHTGAQGHQHISHPRPLCRDQERAAHACSRRTPHTPAGTHEQHEGTSCNSWSCAAAGKSAEGPHHAPSQCTPRTWLNVSHPTTTTDTSPQPLSEVATHRGVDFAVLYASDAAHQLRAAAVGRRKLSTPDPESPFDQRGPTHGAGSTGEAQAGAVARVGPTSCCPVHGSRITLVGDAD
jgi:hypothetical protein